MNWFGFALICTLGWGFADLFYKKGTDEEDRYSHLKIAVWVGLVMGVCAVALLPLAETKMSLPALLENAVRYAPASLCYIVSMVIGYAGLRYLELSIVSPVQNASGAFSLILMTGYLLWSWLQVRKMTAGARQTEPGIYEGKMISAPFVCGAIRPRIYLPENLDEHSRGDILLHEKMHIARHDTLIRMIAYLILSVHWFNPLVWLARHLFTTDTELACDEAVISHMKPEAQKHYAKTILDFAYHKHSYMPVYASFEEAETKKRIRNLVRWKKPTLWTVLGALCICLITGCGFLSDPEKSGQQEADKPETETLTMEVAVHSPDELPAVHYCENPALIEEFTALFAELSKYSQNDHEIIVQKDGFESIPDVFLTCGTKVMTLLRQDFSKETQNNLVKLDFENDQLSITARSETGSINEATDITLTGSPIEIAFNSRYLLEIIKAIDDETVALSFNTSVTPCVAEPVQGNSFYYLVLPVRIMKN